MFKNVKLLSSERVNLKSEDGWVVHMEIDNPKYPNFENIERTRLIHTIPDSAILWRAAELGTEDIDTVLDVLLTENYIQELNPPTVSEHVSRCAQMKLSMRLSTRENKSVLRARAANPEDPTTPEQAEEAHPLSPIRSHLRNGEDFSGKLNEIRKHLRRANERSE